MKQDKATLLDMITGTGLAIILTMAAVGSIVSNNVFMGLVIAAFALFIFWSLLKDLNRGVRYPTRWEWFRAWMNLRPILVGLIGFASLIALLAFEERNDPTEAGKLVIIGGIVTWALLTFYTMNHAQHRRESDAAYKKRTGYQDQ